MGSAQEADAAERGTVRGDALAATLELEKRAGLAPEAGAAVGLSRSGRQQLRGHRPAGADQAAELGAALSPAAPLKRVASTFESTPGRRGARHARRVQQ